jgi:hypothetical protein
VRHVGVLLSAAAAVLVLASPTSAAGTAPAWIDPTPAEGTHVTITGGSTVVVDLAATDLDTGDEVQIEAAQLPKYATLVAIPGNPATATLTIAPPPSAHAVVTVTLVARDTGENTTPRTFVLEIVPDTAPFSLVGPGAVSRWAYILKATTARAAPRSSARAVARLRTATPLGRPNLVAALEGQRDPQGRLWVRVSLPILPNGSTGWVRKSALDDYRVVRTQLVVHRASLTATLLRDDRPVFSTRVGIGRSPWPTPAGEFYVREVIRGFGEPFYGPIAFGMNARSPVLTDWPGGGFIGIHGTNRPSLLPGLVSHGCIRMRNSAILRLAKLMPLGTPVTIR